jgi:hypothetical protein
MCTPTTVPVQELVMPSLVWNNFSAGWLGLVLVSVALGTYIYSGKQRHHDTIWRFTIAGYTISLVISIFMLLYDITSGRLKSKQVQLVGIH